MRAATLFLGFTGVVLAGTSILLWQAFGPRSSQPARPEAAARARAAPGLRPTEPEAGGVRSVYPGLGGTARPTQPPAEATREKPSAQTAIAASEVAPMPRAAPETDRTEREILPDAGQVDLNCATVEQLNTLGAGMIGKTIIANRPYASPDDLVARRVLNRRDYETIRPRIVAR